MQGPLDTALGAGEQERMLRNARIEYAEEAQEIATGRGQGEREARTRHPARAAERGSGVTRSRTLVDSRERIKPGNRSRPLPVRTPCSASRISHSQEDSAWASALSP